MRLGAGHARGKTQRGQLGGQVAHLLAVLQRTRRVHHQRRLLRGGLGQQRLQRGQPLRQILGGVAREGADARGALGVGRVVA